MQAARAGVEEQQSTWSGMQAARDVEDAGADDDVDAESLQIQDFAWDVASLRHRWEQAQSRAAETIEQQSRVLSAAVLPQSAGSGAFSRAGFGGVGLGFGAGAGSAIGSALFGGRGGAFDPSDGETDAVTVEEALSDEDMADEMAEAFGRSREISDGLLTLSREDCGGGWDELPEGVQEAAQHPDGAVDFDAFRELMPLLEHADSGRSPGDDLATDLAMAAEYVLHAENARGPILLREPTLVCRRAR